MPFIKREVGSPSDPQNTLATDMAALGSPDTETRWRAARALGGIPDAVSALATALAVEHTSRVREVMMTALMRIGNEASVAAMLPYLRSQDAALRASVIEALQAIPNATKPFMSPLFEDPDSDVRLLATELTRNMAADDATELLASLIEAEQHPNVCAAAVEVLAEVGTSAALPALRSCAARFAGTPFLPFAISIAISRISDTQG